VVAAAAEALARRDARQPLPPQAAPQPLSSQPRAALQQAAPAAEQQAPARDTALHATRATAKAHTRGTPECCRTRQALAASPERALPLRRRRHSARACRQPNPARLQSRWLSTVAPLRSRRATSLKPAQYPGATMPRARSSTRVGSRTSRKRGARCPNHCAHASLAAVVIPSCPEDLCLGVLGW